MLLSKSDTLAALAGKISSILKCVEGSFTAEAMAYLEQYLTAEKGSRFLEAVRKLEKELGDKMSRLDTAKAKRIVEGLDDGKSVDDVVAELKGIFNSGKFIDYIKLSEELGNKIKSEGYRIIDIEDAATLIQIGQIWDTIYPLLLREQPFIM